MCIIRASNGCADIMVNYNSWFGVYDKIIVYKLDKKKRCIEVYLRNPYYYTEEFKQVGCFTENINDIVIEKKGLYIEEESDKTIIRPKV